MATPGTVQRDYTRSLISEYASGVNVRLVGAENLAELNPVVGIGTHAGSRVSSVFWKIPGDHSWLSPTREVWRVGDY